MQELYSHVHECMTCILGLWRLQVHPVLSRITGLSLLQGGLCDGNGIRAGHEILCSTLMPRLSIGGPGGSGGSSGCVVHAATGKALGYFRSPGAGVWLAAWTVRRVGIQGSEGRGPRAGGWAGVCEEFRIRGFLHGLEGLGVVGWKRKDADRGSLAGRTDGVIRGWMHEHGLARETR
jgi:hypothetical protein